MALLWAVRPAERRPAPAVPAFNVPEGPDRLRVEVLNGTARQGLARVATRELRRRGIDVVLLANADGPSDSTRIVVRRGDVKRGERVRAALGQGRVVEQADTLRRVDASVVLGADYRAPSALHP